VWSRAQPQEVVAVARDDDESMIDGVVQHLGVGRRTRKHFAQAIDVMSKLFEEVTQFVRTS